jgi:RNA-directed DNA polymerase
MSAQELKKIRWFCRRIYQSFEIAKGGTKTRKIRALNKRLKHLQRQLLPLLDQFYEVRNTVHGFVVDR